MAEMDDNQGKKKRRNKSEEQPKYFPDPSTISDADAALIFGTSSPKEDAPPAFLSVDLPTVEAPAEAEPDWAEESAAPVVNIFAEEPSTESTVASLPLPIADTPPLSTNLPPPVADVPPVRPLDIAEEIALDSSLAETQADAVLESTVAPESPATVLADEAVQAATTATPQSTSSPTTPTATQAASSTTPQSQAKDTQAKPTGTTSSQATSSTTPQTQAKDTQAKPTATTSSQAASTTTPQSQAKDSQAKPTSTTSTQAASSTTPQTQAKDSQAKPTSTTSTQAASSTTPQTQAKDSQAKPTSTTSSQSTPNTTPQNQAKPTSTTSSQATPSTTPQSQAKPTSTTSTQTASSTTPQNQAKDSQAKPTGTSSSQAASSTTPQAQAKDSQAKPTSTSSKQAASSTTPQNQAKPTGTSGTQAASSTTPQSQANPTSTQASSSSTPQSQAKDTQAKPTGTTSTQAASSTTPQSQAKDTQAKPTSTTSSQAASTTTPQAKPLDNEEPAKTSEASRVADVAIPSESSSSLPPPVNDVPPVKAETASGSESHAESESPSTTESAASEAPIVTDEATSSETPEVVSDLAAPVADEAATALEAPIADEATTALEAPLADEAIATDAPSTDETIASEAPEAVSDLEAPIADEAVTPLESPTIDEAVSPLEAPVADEPIVADVPVTDALENALDARIADEAISPLEAPITDEAIPSDAPLVDVPIIADAPISDEAVPSDSPAPITDSPEPVADEAFTPLAEPFPTATTESRPIPPPPVIEETLAPAITAPVARPLSPLIATETLSPSGEPAPVFWRWGDMLWMVSAFVSIFLLQAQGFQAPDTLRSILSIVVISLLTLASLGFSAWAVLTFVERRRARRLQGEALRIFFMAQSGLWLVLMIMTIVGLSLFNQNAPARVMVYIMSSLALIWWAAKLVLRILQRHLLRSYDIITNSALFVASFFGLAFPIIAAGMLHSSNISRGYIFKVGEAYGSINIIALTMSIIASLVFLVVVIPEQMRYADSTNRFKRVMEFIGNFLAGNTLEVSGMALGVALAVKESAGLGLASLLITAVGLLVVPYGILDKIRNAREKSGYEEAFQVVLILMSISITLVSLLNFGFAIAGTTVPNAIIALIAGGLAIISTAIEIVELVITGGEGTIWKRGSNLIANSLLILATFMAILSAASTFNASLNNGSVAYAAIGLSLFTLAFIVKFLVEADLLGKLVDILLWIRDRVTGRATAAPVVADAAQEGIAPTGD